MRIISNYCDTCVRSVQYDDNGKRAGKEKVIYHNAG